MFLCWLFLSACLPAHAQVTQDIDDLIGWAVVGTLDESTSSCQVPTQPQPIDLNECSSSSFCYIRAREPDACQIDSGSIPAWDLNHARDTNGDVLSIWSLSFRKSVE